MKNVHCTQLRHGRQLYAANFVQGRHLSCWMYAANFIVQVPLYPAYFLSLLLSSRGKKAQTCRAHIDGTRLGSYTAARRVCLNLASTQPSSSISRRLCHLVSLQLQSFGVAQLVAQELLQGTARVAKPMLPDGCRGVIHVHPLFDTNLLYSANGQIGTYSTFSGSKTKLLFNVCADERIKT